MSEPKDPNPDFSELRRRAEELLKQEAIAPEDLSASEAIGLIHELRVHQIELEMQNEELRRSQGQLEEARHKYLNLYDFAPVGYLTMDAWGRITEANFTAASLLGVERGRLLGNYLWMFVRESERRAFQRIMSNSHDLPRRRGEFHLEAGSEQTRPMLLNVLFTRDENGEEIRRVSLTDITELKEAEGRLEKSREKLSRLTRRLLTVQEEERQRIARDLHDEMGQSLMALKMQLNRVKRRFRRGEGDWQELDEPIDFVNAIAAQAREICQSLRPSALENLGLKGALRQLLEEFKRHHGLEVSEELVDMKGLFSTEAQITVYRLFQECLNNAIRHGKASRVMVRAFKGDGGICFICEDNGGGFDPAEVRAREEGSRGFGLAAMEERVRLLQGTFNVNSGPGQGTRIDIILPPDKKPEKEGAS